LKTPEQITIALAATVQMLHAEAQGKDREGVLLAIGGLRAVEELSALLLGDEHPMTAGLKAAREGRVFEIDGDDARWS
jgi:hypothetical protein